MRDRYFDIESIEKKIGFRFSTVEKAKKILAAGQVELVGIETAYYEGDVHQEAFAKGSITIGKNSYDLAMRFSRNNLRYFYCNCRGCQGMYFRWEQTFCHHLYALWMLIKEHLEQNSVGDYTDLNAIYFLMGFEQPLLLAQEELELRPRLQKKRNILQLSYRIGHGRMYVIKNITDFLGNVRRGGRAKFGANAEFVLAKEGFSVKSRKHLDFLFRLADYQNGIEQHAGYPELRMKQNICMEGRILDDFYELLGEDAVEYEDMDVGVKNKRNLQCIEAMPKISMELDIERNKNKEILGIRAKIQRGECFVGNPSVFCIQDDCFVRCPQHAAGALTPIFMLHDSDFLVGMNDAAKFYYDVLPKLRGLVDIREKNADAIQDFLPVQGKWTFYLDADDRGYLCRVECRSEDSVLNLSELYDADGNPKSFERNLDFPRDIKKEKRIWEVVHSLFEQEENGEYLCAGDAEKMVHLFRNGIEQLMNFGEVQATDAFQNKSVFKKPKLTVGLSLSGGMVDMEVNSDLSAEELWDILSDIRMKKKYHRLRSGEFVELENSEEIAVYEELVKGLHLSKKELKEGSIKLPAYRALYIEDMLAEHDQLCDHREKRYQELVERIHKPDEAGLCVPKDMQEILKPYQHTGFRWLRMMEEYGFGGILADDMGLGKTLQMITFFLDIKRSQRGGTALVVCPASLVYNWGEEIRKFDRSAELRYALLGGSLEERREILKCYTEYDVLITSYHTLHRDIALYEGCSFYAHILDEAQYIKNHSTGMAKSVKVIQSQIRFALTGTPIENRLCELWSIFDFLLPGFLYGYESFRTELESPIVKDGDEKATERLRRMIQPFVLRRLKKDVLSDLPDKIEESRMVKLEKKQKQLYDAQLMHMKEMLAMQNKEGSEKNSLQIFTELMRLRQICCDPSLFVENYRGESAKLESCMELLQMAIDAGHKILLFSQFTSMLEILEKRLKKEKIAYKKITGSTPKKDRLLLVDEFNADDTPVFLISLKAGGIGLNLTGADIVIHYDPWWNIAAQNQATDRAYRIGQEKNVTVYKLIAMDTIEEKIQHLQEMKQELSDRVVGGTDAEAVMQMGVEEIRALLQI